jgi:hypothetical protein
MIEWKIRLNIAGATKYKPTICAIRTSLSIVDDIESQQPIGPTRPAVPMPAPAGLLVILNTIVDI